MLLDAVFKTNGYMTHAIFSTALDLTEETKDNALFITKITDMYQFNEDNHKCILHLTVK